jgi:hypothetical protein
VPHLDIRVTNTGTRQWEKSGNFNDEVEDFNRLNSSNVRRIGGKNSGGFVLLVLYLMAVLLMFDRLAQVVTLQ